MYTALLLLLAGTCFCCAPCLLCCLLPCRPARYVPLFGGRQYHPDRERDAPAIEEQVRHWAAVNCCTCALPS